MATVNLAAVSVAVSLILADPLTDQFRRDAVLLHLLPVSTKRGEKGLYWNPKFDGRTAGGAYAEGADMGDSDFDSHVRAQANLPWAQYRKGAKVSGLALAGSAGANYAGDMSLWSEELSDATDALALDLAADLYAGDPTASPVELAGAAVAVDGSAGTFAALATGTYADWVAAENSLPAADLSRKNLQANLIRPIKEATGRRPDFVTCPGNVWNDIKGLVDDESPVMVKEIRGPNGMVDIMASAGAEAVVIDGVPYIEDRHCTASTLYGIQASTVELVQLAPALPPLANVVAAIKQLTGVDVEVSDVEARIRALYGGQRLTPTIEMLAQTGDAYKAQVKWYGQVKWKRRNANSKLVLT